MACETIFLLIDEIMSSRILIVAGESLNDNNLKAVLNNEGFDAVTVLKSVSDTLEYLRPGRENEDSDVDLIIYLAEDFKEKHIDKIWRAKETCEMLEIPLVVIGDIDYSDELVELVETGCVDFISRYIDTIHLVARLKTLLNLRQANKKLRRHQQELRSLTDELEEKNQRLNSILEDIRFDLNLAGELQRSFLPARQVSCDTMDFAYFYKPCATIGGDLINVIRVTPRFFVVYLLDVSGHGVSAALLAFAIHRYLSSESHQGLIKKANGKLRSPVDVLKMLNRDFLTRNEWFKYFTITYGIYDSKAKTFRYCRAGQTPLLLITKNAEPEMLRHGSPPVGLSEAAVFREAKLQLFSGDSLFLYSDGITEAKNLQGIFYGEERLVQALKKLNHNSLENQTRLFMDQFFSWIENCEVRDDIAFLAMRVK